MKRAHLIFAAILALAAPLFSQVSDKQIAQAPGRDWLTYNGSYDSRRHSSLDQINLANVDRLAARWIYHVPGATHLEGVPVVVNGVMYVTQLNEVYAVDGRSGRQIWDYHRVPAIQKGFNRGVAVYGDKLYVTTADDYLIALDAASGNIVWETKMAEASDGFWSPTAPLIANGKVITGVAPGDRGLNGFVDAYDANTGKKLWRWNPIPSAGEPGVETWAGDSWKTAGGDTWLTGSYDPELNLLYWGIGNPAPDFNGDVRVGDNLYTECVVALDLDTGKLRWYFQFTPHDVMDWDAVEIPILVDVPYQGKMRKLMATADRNGFYYVLDRVTGEYLHGNAFVHQLNWATGLTPAGKPILIPGVEPTLTGKKVCPSSIGATNWMSPAYDPKTGFFYAVTLEGCGFATKNTEAFRPGGYQYRATGDVLLIDDSWKIFVRAFDLTTGKLAWEQERVGSTGLGGGLLSTAGGLIFSGEVTGELVALNAKTGKIAWHFNAGQEISAQPITYSVNGTQYVAIEAGSNVVSFALLDAHKEPAK